MRLSSTLAKDRSGSSSRRGSEVATTGEKVTAEVVEQEEEKGKETKAKQQPSQVRRLC
jgi:hypothetical protein